MKILYVYLTIFQNNKINLAQISHWPISYGLIYLGHIIDLKFNV